MQTAIDAVLGQHLGLADLGATGADGSDGDLPVGDLGALVGLGVGTELQALSGGEVGHALDVAHKGVQLDHQHRRVQRLARTLLIDQVAVQVFVGHGWSLSVRPKSWARWAFTNVCSGSTASRTAKNSGVLR